MLSRRLAVLLAAVVGLACQPADDPDLDADGSAEAAAEGEPVGAPARSMPDDLESLLAELRGTAVQWQSEPAVAEIVVELDGEDWSAATVTYLAPDADRFLLLRVSPEGMTQERPTLEGFELAPVSAAGLAELPEPDGLLDPLELVAAGAAVLDTCEVGEPDAVLYATGAPAAWDGERWTEAPQWTATVSGDAAAVLEPGTGAPAAGDPCVGA